MLRMSEKALVGAGKLKMKEQQVLEFLTGPESEENAVCQDARGHYYCHRQIGCVTIWMEYHCDEGTLWVDNVYHHRIVVQKKQEQQQLLFPTMVDVYWTSARLQQRCYRKSQQL